MPERHVLKRPEDKIDDIIPVDEQDLGSEVEEVYSQLDHNYSIEILDDQSEATRKI
jgi:hypothetical protein